MTRDEIDEWFVLEILPLEGVLMRFLRRNWRDADELADLRQEVYARVLAGCAATRPDSAQAFMLSTARNLLIDRARRARIVSIETFADMDAVEIVQEGVPLERQLAARSELRLLQRALKLLPPRCRQVVELRKIEGLSQREVARRMGITEDTVERQVSLGVRALADAMADTGSASGGEAPATKGLKGASV
jgi:RNA polymerase sigma-70 factor (ECF subfamily)